MTFDSTFQAYLDNIKEKTGKSADDFKQIAKEKGLTTSKEIMAWLKADYGLGFGHSRAIVHVIQSADAPKTTPDDDIVSYFSGGKAGWRETYEGLLAELEKFGPDVRVGTGKTYLSLLRKDKKFGIVQVSGKAMDIGIKLKGVPAAGRFEESGNWNTMVTHRVRVDDPKQIDAELLSWLHQAYQKA